MKGKFNNFGGQYVPETLMNALKELEDEFYKAINDEAFMEEYMYYLKDYTGRPSPLYYAENMTKDLKGSKIYLKREDLNHTGAIIQSGSLPSFSSICFFASSPIILWKTLTIIGYGWGPATVPIT